MDFLKKYWYILVLLCVTAGLGFITYLTSQELAKKTPVAPTVPQVEPKAVEPACTFSFTLEVPTASPTPTTTGAPSATPTSTGVPTATPTSTTAPTATPTVTKAPSATPTTPPPASCNETCTQDSDCVSGLICLLPDGVCRNSQCSDETDCSCPSATATPRPTVTHKPTATPVPPAACNTICNVTADCESGLTCVDGACRNPSCTSETDCVCNIAQGASPTAPPAPQVPVSGVPSILGISAVIGGVLLLLIGLAL